MGRPRHDPGANRTTYRIDDVLYPGLVPMEGPCLPRYVSLLEEVES